MLKTARKLQKGEKKQINESSSIVIRIIYLVDVEKGSTKRRKGASTVCHFPLVYK